MLSGRYRLRKRVHNRRRRHDNEYRNKSFMQDRVSCIRSCVKLIDVYKADSTSHGFEHPVEALQHTSMRGYVTIIYQAHLERSLVMRGRGASMETPLRP
jgi:hypothetical protein